MTDGMFPAVRAGSTLYFCLGSRFQGAWLQVLPDGPKVFSLIQAPAVSAISARSLNRMALFWISTWCFQKQLLRFIRFTELFQCPSEQHPAAKMMGMKAQALPTHPHGFRPQSLAQNSSARTSKSQRAGVKIERFLVILNNIHKPPAG